MSSAAPNKPTQNGEGPTTIEKVDASINEVVALLSNLSTTDAYTELREISATCQVLKERNAVLETTNDSNMKTIARHVHSWETERSVLQERLKAEQDAAAALRTGQANAQKLVKDLASAEEYIKGQLKTIKEKEGEIGLHQSTTAKLKADLNDESSLREKLKDALDTTQKELNRSVERAKEANSRLDCIKDSQATFHKLNDNKNLLRAAFAKTFHQAMELFQSALYCDLSAEALVAGAFADSGLPIPASNSHAAKQMRVAAGLRICANALTSNIFKRTFITNADDLDELLDRLLEEQAQQEMHLRAVLQMVLPDEQKQNRQNAVREAVQDIASAVGKWVQNKERFMSGLKGLCEQANTSWTQALEVEGRIAPNFKFEYEDEWRQLQIPRAQSPALSGPMQSKTVPESRLGPAAHGKPQPSKTQKQHDELVQKSPPESLSTANVVKVIWPAFVPTEELDSYTNDQDDVDFFYYGYVLTKTQTSAAEEEVAMNRGARRAMKRTQSGAHKTRWNSTGTFPS